MKKYISLFLGFFLVLLTINRLSSVDFWQRKNIAVVFRYDDYSSLSNEPLEQEILDIFENHDIPLTIGVIPFGVNNPYSPEPQDLFPLYGEKLETLKTFVKKGVAEVALHGYSHQANADSKMTEFSGLPFQRQMDLISAGKIHLEDSLNTPISVFIPPWNSYDQNTINALEELGFLTLSANKDGLIPESSDLNLLPATCSLDDLQEGILAAKKSSTREPILVVLFHAYDFLEVDKDRGTITFPEFSELMTWLSSQSDVTTLSIGQAVQNIEGLSVNRYSLAQTITPQEVFIESTLGEGKINDILYRAEEVSLNAWLEAITFYLLVTSVCAFFTFLVAKWLIKARKQILKLLTVSVILMSAILAIYVFSDQYVYKMGMTIIAAAIGISIGFLTSYLTIQYLHFSENPILPDPIVMKN